MCKKLFSLFLAILVTISISNFGVKNEELAIQGRVESNNSAQSEKPAKTKIQMGEEDSKENVIEVKEEVEVEEKAEEEKKEEEDSKVLAVANPTVNKSNGSQYRLTSYYKGDGSGDCTGTGLCTWDFQVNERGWYTYQGKLVLAGASYACLREKSGACGKWNVQKSDRDYYNYYDVVTLEIDGVRYEGIILDSCGASMSIDYEQRLDLFVSSESAAIDRGYKGNNTITVWK